MIKRSFDLELLLRATDLPQIESDPDKFKQFFYGEKNLMFADGENVGLATYEYPGCYTLHWYFEVRGREALNLGAAMIKNLFDNYGAKIVRGIVRVDLKASRWAARQIGWKSHGIVRFSDGTDNEVFTMTQEDLKWVK